MQLTKRQQKLRALESSRNSAKKSNPASYVNQAPFRYAERNFKSRSPPPDMTEVFDFANMDGNADVIKKRIVEVKLKSDLRGLCSLFGDSEETWRDRWDRAYVIKGVPGLVVIPNPFSPPAQRHLVRRCLRVHARHPNLSNLDTHYNMPPQGLWELVEREWRGDLRESDKDYFVSLKKIDTGGEDGDTMYNEEEEDYPRQPDIPSSSSSNDSQHATTPTLKLDPLPSPTVPVLSPRQLIRKLRWTTLGYQYHWATKTYHLDRRVAFPEDVGDIATAVVRAVEGVGLNEEGWRNDYAGDDFRPQAGVINYYQPRDALMGHVDQSELNMKAPLVSVSLGHDCIYLMGGPTRDTKPVALRLRSGDIVVMTGESRTCFHGVPRILENTLPGHLAPEYWTHAATPEQVPDDDWRIFGEYISEARINLNVRQVFDREVAI
ncbi:hypothetical protein BC936DRAFT_146730 [Jimgerdemannia flammicorona]|uniref:Fe2OG dioxygenase domain-containing protein n=1 Tax=Jimgerdemannia flammicorona TaxID=994334 RepID=A0A433DLB2_9FUNG|nr:hypothetical protein BC936DRAFT_146730 [Jimgerdemannia flammicorona]